MIRTAWCKVLLPLMRNSDNVPRQLITFAINYSYDLFAAGLCHPLALPLTAAEFVSLLQTATPTQVNNPLRELAIIGNVYCDFDVLAFDVCNVYC